jgi:tetratricopeptide (TPR) repeat protein
MARTVTVSVVLSLLVVAVGCQTGDTSRAYQLPRRDVYNPPTTTTNVVDSNDELALVEQVFKNRQDYSASLQKLLDHYVSVGDNVRQGWARQELQALDRIPQFVYVIDPSVFPADLHGTARIVDADKLYAEAAKTERLAAPVGLVRPTVDEGKLRIALQQYERLIRQYPTSDKIDEAAWRLAGIYEYFGNYGPAITFYERTFQWDPTTTYPARFNAASLLDKLGRRDEALPLYQEAVAKEARHPENTAVAKRRIQELTNPPK